MAANNNVMRDSRPRSKNLKHKFIVTLEQLFNGTVRRLVLNKNVECGVCHGSGSKCTLKLFDHCERCHGYGNRTVTIRSHPNAPEVHVERMCDLCRGRGKAIIGFNRCHTCAGGGTVPRVTYVDFVVEPGMRHGMKELFKEAGNQEPEKRPGDVLVIIEQLPHQKFQRIGDDLMMTMQLDLVESLCGVTKLVTTLDNRTLYVTSPRGKVIKNNDKMSINGEGMPKYQNPNEKGRLIVKFEVVMPPTIDATLTATVEQILAPRPTVHIPENTVEVDMLDVEFAEDEGEDNIDYENETLVRDNGYRQEYDHEPEYRDHGNGSYEAYYNN